MNEQAPVTPVQLKKNRWMLLLLLATFVVPFVAGDLAYKLGWYQGGQTNRGQLIDPPVAFGDFKARNAEGPIQSAAFAKEGWWLLYVLPAQCDAACHNRLFQMRQVRKALGKEADRVRPLLVVTTPLAAETDILLAQEFSEFVRLEASAQDVNAALVRLMPDAANAGQLYIMDPMGWLMLTYAPEADEKVSVIKAEDILNDLKKLLKASRIG